MSEAVLFAGPSLQGAAAGRVVRAGLRLAPPARRGDVAALLRKGAPPGVVVLADGVFQVAPAVSHAEICAALDAGWQVWGVASLGAIRAAELRAQGMRGFGWVYEAFAGEAQLHDDEACLLHFPEPPWFPVTEALVNLRAALLRRGPVFGIPPAVGREVVGVLRGEWFGERSHERIAALLVQRLGAQHAGVAPFMDWLRAHPVKSLDLARLLRLSPWRATAVPASAPRSG